MKQMRLLLCGTALFLTGLGQNVFGADEAPLPGGRRNVSAAVKVGENPVASSDSKPNEKGDSKSVAKEPEKKPASEKESAKRSPDEEAIRLTGDTYTKAFCDADAKLVASHFTSDAEYVDEGGDVHQGREAIQEAMTTLFKENKGCQIEINIDSIRFISPGVAIEDGTTAFTNSDDDEIDIVFSGYTAIHVKQNGKWLTASVREHAPKNRRQHRSQLQQLSWLQGDWVDEGDDLLVIFSCNAIDGGNFLLREFKIHIAGQEAMNGTQRIGWDPLTSKLKSWVFDSEGGYSEGFWHRDGDRWVLKSFGVTADGEPASSTTIYTQVDEDTMTWQSVDHEVGGVELPDSEPVTIVRRAPAPLSADDTLTLKSE